VLLVLHLLFQNEFDVMKATSCWVDCTFIGEWKNDGIVLLLFIFVASCVEVVFLLCFLFFYCFVFRLIDTCSFFFCNKHQIHSDNNYVFDVVLSMFWMNVDVGGRFCFQFYVFFLFFFCCLFSECCWSSFPNFWLLSFRNSGDNNVWKILFLLHYLLLISYGQWRSGNLCCYFALCWNLTSVQTKIPTMTKILILQCYFLLRFFGQYQHLEILVHVIFFSVEVLSYHLLKSLLKCNMWKFSVLVMLFPFEFWK
jgi:hypothetical protein